MLERIGVIDPRDITKLKVVKLAKSPVALPLELPSVVVMGV